MKKATPPFTFRLAVYRWKGDFSRSLISLQGSRSKITVSLTNTTTFPSLATMYYYLRFAINLQEHAINVLLLLHELLNLKHWYWQTKKKILWHQGFYLHFCPWFVIAQHFIFNVHSLWAWNSMSLIYLDNRKKLM